MLLLIPRQPPRSLTTLRAEGTWPELRSPDTSKSWNGATTDRFALGLSRSVIGLCRKCVVGRRKSCTPIGRVHVKSPRSLGLIFTDWWTRSAPLYPGPRTRTISERRICNVQCSQYCRVWHFRPPKILSFRGWHFWPTFVLSFLLVWDFCPTRRFELRHFLPSGLNKAFGSCTTVVFASLRLWPVLCHFQHSLVRWKSRPLVASACFS